MGMKKLWRLAAQKHEGNHMVHNDIWIKRWMVYDSGLIRLECTDRVAVEFISEYSDVYPTAKSFNYSML